MCYNYHIFIETYSSYHYLKKNKGEKMKNNLKLLSNSQFILRILLISLTISFIVSSCSGIDKKYKKTENKAIVFFNQPVSLTPIYIYKDGTLPDYPRSYREMIEKSPKDDYETFEKTVKGFRNFNRSVIDKAIRNNFGQLARLTENKINGKFSWLKAIDNQIVTRPRAIGGGGYSDEGSATIFLGFNILGIATPSLGVDLKSLAAYKKAMRPMEEKIDDFYTGKIATTADWLIEIRIIGWFIYSSANPTVYLSGIPTSGQTAQEIQLQMKIYDKKSKNSIFDQKQSSKVLINEKSVVEIGQQKLPVDIQDWDTKTTQQIEDLLNNLVLKMNQ